MSGVDTLTEAGTLIGTAAYMSPEQASGEGATPASDVYSFGVILFRMLTGRLPFETPSPVDLLRRQLYEAPPAIHSLRPDAPMTLAAVAEESLAKSPADRPPDGRALVGLLSGAIVPVAGDAATQVIPPPRSTGVRWLLAALIGVPLLILAGIALALVATDNGSNTPAPASTPGTTIPTTTAPSTATPAASSTTSTATATPAAASSASSPSTAAALAASTAPPPPPLPPPPPAQPPPPQPPPPPP